MSFKANWYSVKTVHLLLDRHCVGIGQQVRGAIHRAVCGFNMVLVEAAG